MWFHNTVFYHIYPLGACGAPHENDGHTVSRISALEGWVEHLSSLGTGAVYFGPLFESDRHGYDTRDYRKLDCRLGTNTDFARVCEALRKAGIRIVLDGVFNHVGRGFWAFRDVLQNKAASPYKDWFHIDFGRNSNYNDGLWYEGWEGHYELVKLNLKNPAVTGHLLECVREWIEQFGIDGLRLDVAYMLDRDFMRSLRSFTKSLRDDFFLLGEAIHGDYKQLLGQDMLNSVTNYECYKGLFSSFNTMNLYEIGYSLNRQFGPEQWTLYKGEHLFNFLDNHDVSRIAGILSNSRHIEPAYALMFAMPGIPCVYYGSEWGEHAKKEAGDDALRPAVPAPKRTGLTDYIARLARLHASLPPLCNGSYRQLVQTNRQLVFAREAEAKRVIIAINADENDYSASFADMPARMTELISGKSVPLAGSLPMPAFSAGYWVEEGAFDLPEAEARVSHSGPSAPGTEAPLHSPSPESTPDFSQIGIRVLVKDFAACHDFYTEKLGLIPSWGDRNGPFASFCATPGGPVCFSMFDPSHMGMFRGYAEYPGAGHPDKTVYVIPSQNVDSDYRTLLARGVEFLGEPQTIPQWYMRCTYFRDPEGNLFELCSEMDGSQ